MATTKRPTRSRKTTSKKTPTKKVKKSRAKKEVHEVSSGGVVFKKTSRGYAFAMMLDSYGKWTFPKGRVEKGESLEEAAARETLEELGMTEVRLLDYLGKIDIWFRDHYEKKGALVHKDIHYFLFQAPKDAKLNPDPAHRSFEAKWIPLSQVTKKSSYEDMVDIIRLALALVKEQR